MSYLSPFATGVQLSCLWVCWWDCAGEHWERPPSQYGTVFAQLGGELYKQTYQTPDI